MPGMRRLWAGVGGMSSQGRTVDLVRPRFRKAPQAITFDRVYPGTISQPGQVRSDLAEITGQYPVADDVALLASELATNAILHTRSGHPGRVFTVRATLYPGDYAWVEVVDAGGAWSVDEHDDEHGRGLAIVAAIAGDGNWGIEGDSASRVVWFRLDWPQAGGSNSGRRTRPRLPAQQEQCRHLHRYLPGCVGD